MIKEILTAAGIPYQEAQYPDPPEGTFAVWLEGVDTDGADCDNRIFTHNCTVELYAPTIETGNEDRSCLFAELNARGVHYTTQGWYWLNSIRRYQEVIEFKHIEKRRN